MSFREIGFLSYEHPLYTISPYQDDFFSTRDIGFTAISEHECSLNVQLLAVSATLNYGAFPQFTSGADTRLAGEDTFLIVPGGS